MTINNLVFRTQLIFYKSHLHPRVCVEKNEQKFGFLLLRSSIEWVFLIISQSLGQFLMIFQIEFFWMQTSDGSGTRNRFSRYLDSPKNGFNVIFWGILDNFLKFLCTISTFLFQNDKICQKFWQKMKKKHCSKLALNAYLGWFWVPDPSLSVFLHQMSNSI